MPPCPALLRSALETGKLVVPGAFAIACLPAALRALLHTKLCHRAEEPPVLRPLCLIPLVREQNARRALSERVQCHPFTVPSEFDEADGSGIAVRA